MPEVRAAIDADDNSRCARCGVPFHCGVADAEPCACSTLQLDAATLAALRASFTGCLCIACLSRLAAAAASPEGTKRATGPW
jgi:ribosomal protein L34E